MRGSFRIRQFAGLAVGCALFTACTAAGTPSPAATATAPAASSSSAASAAPKGELPKPELTTLRLGAAAISEMSQFAFIQAVGLKLYEKYGITATATGFEGEAKAVGALQSGQIDIADAGPGSAMLSQLTDVPVILIGMTATILTDDLICRSSIKTAAAVKGTKVAISTFGGPAHASALLALKSINLSVSDVQLTQVGGQTVRIAALKSGSVDCAVVDKVLQADMIAAGLNVVAKVYDPPQAFGRANIVVTKSFLDKNPKTVLVALAAILESQNLIWTDTEGTAQRFAQSSQTDIVSARSQVVDMQTIGNRSMLWTDEAFINNKKLLASVNPDIIDVDIAKAQDKTLLQKLLDDGFYAKIGNPATCVGWTPTKPC
jgi:ABC-type nitrate/sulfonate/bicarbonate transport system substrate-binding protein